MLTLKQFELQINHTIVQRGREYYENGLVADLQETGNGFWHAEVTGNETYTVEINILRKNIVDSWSCDCPYEGNTCKHVVAVLFRIREELADSRGPEKMPAQTGFDKLLQSITLEECREFIAMQAARDKRFKALFEGYFAGKDDSINAGENYTRLLRSMVDNISDGEYVDYKAIPRFANDIHGLLEEGQLQIQKGNLRNTLMLARAVLTTVIELVTYYDDSGSYISPVLTDAAELLSLIASTANAPDDLLKEVLVFVQSAVNDRRYFDYGDFGYSLADIYHTLAIKLHQEKEYLEFIDSRLKMASKNEFTFEKDFFIVKKIAFLRAIGNTGEAGELVQKYMDVTAVRKEEVNRLIERKELEKAKKLVAEGIKIAEKKGHPGTVIDWEKVLLRIAVIENDLQNIRGYTKQLAFNRHFDLAYYNQWKATFDTAEWELEIEKYIEERVSEIEQQYEANRGRYWHSPDTILLDLLAPIYIQEKYWDRLLSLMSRETDLNRLLQYHHYLQEVYPLQLLAIYLPAFMRKGDMASNRREYIDLANKMAFVMAAIPEGKEEIIDVAEELKRKYVRRPAMVEELTRVIKMARQEK